MSAYTDALQRLHDRQLSATTDEERRQIIRERTELLRAHHRGEKIPFDYKAAQAGRDV